MELPPEKKFIGRKWVYKVKYMDDGSVKRDKARVAVRGDIQVESVNFTKILSHIVKFSTVKSLIVMAIKKA